MGTQQSRSGHGRQGSQQQSQQTARRPEQDRDLQRNKQSDRSQQQHPHSDRNRQQQQASSASGQQSAASSGQQSAGSSGPQQMQPERQQSQLGGNRDFTHKMENEGREQNREQQNLRRQQSQQNVHGEGNYAASKQYNEATKDYTQSGRVDDAARAAAPKSDADAREMDAAEAEGKRHAKGEDPALSRRASSSSGESSATPRPGHEEP
jgi:hypothetical protein